MNAGVKPNLPVIAETSTLGAALTVIGEHSNQIALVVDDDGRLLGTLTDGDVRRGLLRGVQLSDVVTLVMNGSPLILPATATLDDIRSLMRSRRIHHVPIVDDAGLLVDLVTVDDIDGMALQHWDGLAVIMAGGQGRRLRPHTEFMPKPLLEVGGRSMIETMIDRLAEQGFMDVCISVGYRADMIRDRLGDGSAYGVHIDYLHEDKPLGTAGPLRLLDGERAASRRLLVINGDIVTDLNFRSFVRFHEEHDAVATMGVREYDLQVPYGVVNLESGVIRAIEEKPVRTFQVNAGLYVLDPAATAVVRGEGIADMPDLFRLLVARGSKTVAFPVREYWRDVGRLSDLDGANAEAQVSKTE